MSEIEELRAQREGAYTAASGLDDPTHPAVKRVIALADAEQADLRAEVERLRAINHELVDTHNTYLVLLTKAEARLRKVEALADEWARLNTGMLPHVVKRLRAALAAEVTP